MDNNELPDEFDLIVIGTGFSESCVAAAASRIGKTVLHVDLNEFYGGCWASFNLEAFQEFLNKTGNNKDVYHGVKNTSWQWHINEQNKETDNENVINTVAEDGDKNIPTVDVTQWSRSKLLSESRRFNIDLSPKIMFSAGALVELLISSNICRYAEFRAIDKLCTKYQNEIVNVPCSRTDIFNTKDLSIVEKRLLMKFLTSCVNYGTENNSENFSEYSGKLFIDYLKAHHLTEKIIHCVLYAIAMCHQNTLFEEGIEKTKKFLLSLGRYGNTPFLFPMYGCGELPQCFCRLCAVFGGTYCLNQNIEKIEFLNTKDVASILVEGKSISAKNIVLSPEFLPLVDTKICHVSNLNQHGSQISRGVFITSFPIGNEDLNSGGGGVNLIRLMADNKKDAFIIQLSHFSGTCPKGLYLIHIVTEAVSENPQSDIEPFYKEIFCENEGLVLFSAYFTICAHIMEDQLEKETRIYCSAGPFFELDYDKSISNAKDIFTKIYPNEEFLPRAPDPEEIILGDEDPLAIDCLPEDLQEQIKQLENEVADMEITE